MTEVSPHAFVEATLAYQKTAAIRAAIALDLFTLINAGNDTVTALAERTDASPRGLRILCDYLTVHGFLEKSNDRYTATPSSRAFLDRTSPSYLGSIVEFHAAPDLVSLFLADPVSYVRHGGATGPGSTAPGYSLWSIFAGAMRPVMAPIAAAIAKQAAVWPQPPRRVLDIAAGHGIFGIAIVKAIAGAEVTAVDWPAVLAIARANAEAAGVGASYRTLEGSAFEVDWGKDYDLVLVPNFMHHFDASAGTGLLRKIRASLAAGGRAVAVEFVPNEDRVSPPFQAGFAFYMLGSTPSGDAFTASDFQRMARESGFAKVVVTPLPHSVQSLVWFEP